MAERVYKPAAGFHVLTPLFDPVVAVVTRERTFKSRLLDHAALAPGEHVLDLGCGTGTLAIAALERQPRARLTGLDADPEVLSKAQHKAAAADAELTLDEGFSTDLPYGDASFDVVLSTLFFHHLDDDAKRRTAVEIARVLRPEGRLVVGDLGRPQGPLMRGAVLAVQLLDGFKTTSANVAGKLPGMLADAGVADVRVFDRLRTPIGTIELLAATR